MRGGLRRLGQYFRRAGTPPDGSWLARTSPFSSQFGLDRGRAIDRKYMEQFLSGQRAAITGSVLEIGDDRYTLKFGSDVARSVVLAGVGRGAAAISVPDGDLTSSGTYAHLGRFDCVIATNVINFIYEFDAAAQGLARLTAPVNGVMLATASGTGPVSRFDYERWGDYWRFTDMALKRIFEKHFRDVSVHAYGNAPMAAAFAMGLAQEDVPSSLFETHDPDHQILVAVVARDPITD